MKLDDLKPGATVFVPSGASLTHTRPYRLAITDVFVRESAVEGYAYVGGFRLRASGTPTPWKKPRRVAFVCVDKLVLIEAAKEGDAR